MDLGIEGEYSDRERGVATAGSVTIRRWWNEAPPPAVVRITNSNFEPVYLVL